MAIPNYPPDGPTAEVERVRSWVARYFPVYETRLTPHSIVLLVHADAATLEGRFDGLRQDLWKQFYVPQVRYERGEYLVEVIRRPARSTWGPWVNLALLIATALTTGTAGAIIWLLYRGGATLTSTDFLDGGIFFALPLIAILGFHEFAHYLVARRHHVEASLPYFLPVPPPYLLFGTFGAFISLREPIPSKKALIDIGAAGPLAGFALAIPITIGGLLLSTHSPHLGVTNCGPVVLGTQVGNLLFGSSFIWAFLGLFVPGSFQNLQPLALAGWVGLLVTAMNLLPAGQLDGGHVFRALFGPRAAYVSIATVVILLFLGVFFYPGWIIFGFLIFLLGVRHPPPLNDVSPLDGRRIAVGALAIVILVGGFVIVPLTTPTGKLAIIDHSGGPNGAAAPGGMADNLTMVVQDQDLVPYGYVLSGRITAVVANLNGSTQPLGPNQLPAFEANSSWTVYAPNGNVSTFARSATFALPIAQYSKIGAGQHAAFQVVFSNPMQATVYVELTASAVCSNGANPQGASFELT